MKLSPDQPIDLREVLRDLERYRPRRKGWHWREKVSEHKLGPFVFKDTSRELTHSVPLMAAHAFGGIDPQCDRTLTTEIASGRFEDDLRRMRMAAWHGADHIMVIRTTGQSHFDGLIEGTPEGVGGVPISRKQIRATRKALDAIEDEVGRPINFHSYVSGVAGPEIAVVFAEEGVNGCHQDPQYNVLYRDVNMHRAYVDAAEAKRILADGGILQLDGAHNANATAKEAWKVTPELLVQHAINCAYSRAAGMPQDLIALSTVPPTAPPAPKLRLDLPYAVALRELFRGYCFRAQQNTRYMESDTREATITHVLDTLISRLTSADIQSTITPDEGRNIPWHYNNVAGVNTARQTFMGLDGLDELVDLKQEGVLREDARAIKERAVLFLEEILESGGYYAAVAAGQFVDSGHYPERKGDGIVRDPGKGDGAGSVIRREPDYGAPVCSHFGHNALAPAHGKACDAIGGCTLCNPEKIRYIDELDPEDCVDRRLETPLAERAAGLLRPEVEKQGDGVVCLTVFVPAAEAVAEAAALEMARHMNLKDPQVISRRVMHPAEGSVFEIKGVLDMAVDIARLPQEARETPLPDAEIEAWVRPRDIHVVAATVGEDEHSVGLHEILDIKHGGIEKYGFHCHDLGTSVPVERLLDAAEETGARAVLVSTIVTHGEVHKGHMQRLDALARERGMRDRLLLIAGGPQVTAELAQACGMDAGFGRGTTGREVASFIVRSLRQREKE
ncbi:LuxR family transcriptional regulator [Thioalkalivibrio denitrificans]|uniref:LuxR family transcriptional regulator n=1 Tax=Thioalkalivibrio denitrificans TaxID=108003 RepID=A0A1V3NNV5_9GAMM|nr:D-ornithine 4,5-aminomutase subunit OraE [Thioalkalivibrio denitrificans]OOG26436.1 LuxR family transcriptional regulator [Thioalkalivibrio denitrificans]